MLDGIKMHAEDGCGYHLYPTCISLLCMHYCRRVSALCEMYISNYALLFLVSMAMAGFSYICVINMCPPFL